jgi:hypothetical protein
LSCGSVDRQAEIIGEIGAWPAFGLIFVKDAYPVAVEKALRVGW